MLKVLKNCKRNIHFIFNGINPDKNDKLPLDKERKYFLANKERKCIACWLRLCKQRHT